MKVNRGSSLLQEPRPIPKHPYSDTEIEDYTNACFIAHVRGKKQKSLALARVHNYLKNLPAWVQVLLVENRITIEIGTNGTTGLTKEADGDSTPGTYQTRLHKDLLGTNNLGFESTLSHEIGHDIDNILGNHLALKHDGSLTTYMSEISPSWVIRMKRELTPHNSQRKKHNPARQMRDYLIDSAYKPESFPRETFAIMMSHYLLEHFKSSDEVFISQKPRELKKIEWYQDETAINDYLGNTFPNMWPYFRDDMLPIALQISSELYHRRRAREEDANKFHSAIMSDLIEAVAEKYKCPPLRRNNLVAELVGSSANTDWNHLLERLTDPLPKTQSERLKVLFPAVFEPIWGAVDKDYAPRSFPEMNREASMFAANIEQILHEEGIEAFLQHYKSLWEGFEQCIEAREKKARPAAHRGRS